MLEEGGSDLGGKAEIGSRSHVAFRPKRDILASRLHHKASLSENSRLRTRTRAAAPGNNVSVSIFDSLFSACHPCIQPGSVQALSSSSGTYAFADESCIRAKNDVPKNRRDAVITILEAMMCEVPYLS